MRLTNLHIKNLKGLNSVELKLPKTFDGARQGQADVVLLYGDNGVGKTTVLEAISLLGHLSTMTRILAGTGLPPVLMPSVFREKLADCTLDPPWSGKAFADLAKDLEHANLETWWEQIWVDPLACGRVPATLRYVVARGELPVTCYVWFRQLAQGASITEALSRQGESDDGGMDNEFAVIYDHKHQHQVVDLIEHMYDVSPHYYRCVAEPARHSTRTLDKEQASEIVAYWNTDLNDFGRKNDLRESVKKLRVDSPTELVERLNLSLLNRTKKIHRPVAEIDSDPSDLQELNESLGKVIGDRALLLERRSEGRAAFQVLQMNIGSNPVQVRVTKSDPSETEGILSEIDIDHMSAGENESFFIFLLLHGMPVRHSIILLDEPDLHLSEFCKERFFRELYRIAAANGIQLMISTHSGFAYVPSYGIVRKLLDRKVRLVPRNASVSFTTDWNEEYGRLLAISYFRYTGAALSATGLIGRCLGWLLTRWSNLAVRRIKHLRLFWSVTLLLLVVAGLSSVSFVLDLLNFANLQPLDSHGVWIQVVVPLILVLAFLVFLVEMLDRDSGTVG